MLFGILLVDLKHLDWLANKQDFAGHSHGDVAWQQISLDDKHARILRPMQIWHPLVSLGMKRESHNNKNISYLTHDVFCNITIITVPSPTIHFLSLNTPCFQNSDKLLHEFTIHVFCQADPVLVTTTWLREEVGSVIATIFCLWGLKC